jgi:LysM repeat protein
LSWPAGTMSVIRHGAIRAAWLWTLLPLNSATMAQDRAAPLPVAELAIEAPPIERVQVPARLALPQAPVEFLPEDVIQLLEVDQLPALLNKHSEWKFWDLGEDPGAQWQHPDFDDGQWASGSGPLGYGEDDIDSEVQYGDDEAMKHMVTFFRHKFTVKDPAQVTGLAGSLLCDDAAAVYLNGKEVFRRNLPEGELTLSTPASEAIGGARERTNWEFTVDPKLLRAGDNTVAVRVHQCNPASSDLAFELELKPLSRDAAKRLERRLAQRPAGVRAVVAAPAFLGIRRARPARRSMIQLTDGEVRDMQVDGAVRTQRMDAIQQARAIVPSAKFVRVLQGDTLAKVAARHAMDVKKLALLNRSVVERVYSVPDIVCIAWTHSVRPSETLVDLARTYNIDPKHLAELNDLDAQGPLKPGTRISVPGEFKYRFRRNGMSHLQLARYVDEVRPAPFDNRLLKLRQARLKPGQNLQDFLDEHKVAEDFLRKMNGLGPDEPPREGEWLLVEYSVELGEDATLDDMAQHFNMAIETLLEVNQLKPDQAVEPGRRIEIPIGAQLHNAIDSRGRGGTGTEVNVFEVELQADDS